MGCWLVSNGTSLITEVTRPVRAMTVALSITAASVSPLGADVTPGGAVRGGTTVGRNAMIEAASRPTSDQPTASETIRSTAADVPVALAVTTFPAVPAFPTTTNRAAPKLCALAVTVRVGNSPAARMIPQRR